MIHVSGLSYRYPGAERDALDGVSLHVADGELLLVAGASGSGKSTLARAIAGLVPHFHGGAFSGSVVVAGRDTRTHRPRDLADAVGFVAQDPEAQAVVDRVEDEIVFAMENLGIEPILMRKRLEEILDALGLTPLRNRRLDTLSGGERQRVAIAAALAAQPRALVLDEPTSQLDPQAAEEVLALLQRLNADLGLSIVLVEHRLERVVQYVDRMIVLDEGRVVRDGSPRDVMRDGPLGTPLARLARELGWDPLPLTIREGRVFARDLAIAAPRRERNGATPAGEPLIQAAGLRVARGGKEVLRGVDVTVAAGETLAVVGRNGAGKTTLLRTLVGLLRPHAGGVRIAGLDPAHAPIERIGQRVAYVPQSPDAILFHDSVEREVRFTLKARAPSSDPSALLEDAGLAPDAQRDPRELSEGFRLRAAIVAATAGRPDVVLLDEPTRGMDAWGRDWLTHELQRLRLDGRAVIVVTHDVELVARTATRVMLLADGEVVVDGAVRDVLGESALFSSQMNKVFSDRRILTVEDALEAVARA